MALHLIDRIAVEDEGQGDAVVCVHGLGGSSNTFTPLMPALSRHRVLRVDLPGSGRSQQAEGPLSIARFVEALALVCGRLGIARAHFVAHSMGTIVCQHLAVTQPRLVRSLALFGPLGAPTDTARNGIRGRAGKARSEGTAGMQDITEGLLQGALSNDTRQRLPLALAFVRESLMRQSGEAYAQLRGAGRGTGRRRVRLPAAGAAGHRRRRRRRAAAGRALAGRTLPWRHLGARGGAAALRPLDTDRAAGGMRARAA
jgi:3-oxoadipate enol-lactonase